MKAWVGETPSTPPAERSFGERSSGERSSGERRKKKGGRSRTGSPAERAEAKAARDAAATAAVEADPEGVGRTILLDSLTGQARTRKELADKLATREVPDEVATELLDRFADVGLIDDSAYAQQWVESRHRSRGLAPRALAQELRRKGIGDEEAKEALEQIDEDDQRTAARALVDKKMRTMTSLDRQVATRRLAGLLARRGYSAGLAFSVVREAFADADDEVDHDFLDGPPED